MNILHVSNSDSFGGAANAAYRIHHSLLRKNMKSRILVMRQRRCESHIYTPYFASEVINKIRAKIASMILCLAPTSSNGFRSLCLFPSFLVSHINNSDADVVHLHWVQSETLSLHDIANITKPLVWSLHDTWPLAGTRHQPTCLYPDEIIYGKSLSEAPRIGSYFNLDYRLWLLKKHLFSKKSGVLLSPSRWVDELALASPIFKGWVRKTIPHPLDLSIFKPSSKTTARSACGLPLHKKILLFVSAHGCSDPEKGWKQYLSSLSTLIDDGDSILVLTIGGSQTSRSSQSDRLQLIHHSYVSSQHQMANYYRSADLLVVASSSESFGLVSAEALACGTPVVTFSTGGSADIVDHNKTGLVVKSGDYHLLASSSLNLLSRPGLMRKMSSLGVSKAQQNWEQDIVADQLIDVYESLCK